MSLLQISRAFRLPARSFSSLRSTRTPGPRGRIGRTPAIAGIPDNATKASNALLRPNQDTPAVYNSMMTPVHVPEDPNAVINSGHPAARLLENSSLVVQRQIELGNILIGFEQANKYVIMDPAGNHVGFMAEEENTMTKTLMRQLAKTHRSFTTHVFDKHGAAILKFHRPFAFINSTITAYDIVDPNSPTSAPTTLPQDQSRIIGEVQQEWHLLRRKYNLFVHRENTPGEQGEGVYQQFAYVDEPFLSWDFNLLSEHTPPRLVGSVNRNFSGFAREIFTDTGVYALRMDAASVAAEPSNLLSSSTPPVYPPTQALQGAGEVAGSGRGMTLDERAIMLSAAVSIDFDYFSRHSSMGHGSGGFMPMVFGGGEHHTTQGADVGAGAAVGGIAAGLPGQQLPEQVGAPQQPPPGHEGGYMDDQQPVMDDPWGESGQTQPDPWGGSGQSQPGDTWGAEPQAPPSDVEGAGFDPVEWIFGDS